MAAFEYGNYSEDALSALRMICLVSLSELDRDEAISAIYDTYGEGDDELLELMMRWVDSMYYSSKEAILNEYRRLCETRPLTRNT